MGYFDEEVVEFYKSLVPPKHLPNGISWLYPQQQPEVMEIVEVFFKKYCHDKNRRELIFGINPGRFGAGVTGINFTAPRQLKEECGIDHHFKDQTELSASFIYEVIRAFGGPEKFYSKYFISSVCPLGFVKDDINLNYYDDAELLRTVWPFIEDSFKKHLRLPVKMERVICIGGGKNLKYFEKLNNEFKGFGTVISLPHPRYIMQYKRKEMEQWVERYVSELRAKV